MADEDSGSGLMPMVNSFGKRGTDMMVATFVSGAMPLRTGALASPKTRSCRCRGVVESVVIARIAHEHTPPVADVVVELVRAQ